MAKGKARRSRSIQDTLSGFMYQIVLSVAALAGLLTYSGGAGWEEALLRGLLVLLLCTTAACTANMALWLAQLKQAQPGLLPEPALALSAGWQGREIEGQARRIEDAPADEHQAEPALPAGTRPAASAASSPQA